MHMPVHEEAPLHAPSPSETPVACGLSFSPGTSFTGMLKATIAFGSLVASSSAARPDLGLVQQAVKMLGQADPPVTKLMFGEEHGAHGNYNLLGRLLEGFADAAPGEDLHFYKEWNYAPGDPMAKDVEWRMGNATSHRADREAVVNFMNNHLYKASDPIEEARRFSLAALRPAVAFKLMNWADPSRADMSAFIADLERAFAMAGGAHFLSKLLEATGDPNLATEPWLGKHRLDKSRNVVRNIHVLPGMLQQPRLTVEAQREMLNGFARANDVAPTVFVMSSSGWACDEWGAGVAEPEGRPLAPNEKRDRFIKYYNGKGFAVMEVPFAKGLNATMVVPAQYLPQLKAFAAEHTGHVRIHAEGLQRPKPAPGEAREDL
jgi:hypothetical protein